MDSILKIVALLALAFLVGSIPTAFLMGRLRGIDIRRHGSGNVGATNAFRVLGKGWGIGCLLLDALKGWLPVTLLAATTPVGLPAVAWPWALGLAAILGHMFTPWLGWSGGKGVATSLGVILAIEPLATLGALAVGLAIIGLTGYVSLASLTGAALLPLLIVGVGLARQGDWDRVSFFVTLALAAAIFYKHRGNIVRLRAGTESRLFQSKTGESTR